MFEKLGKKFEKLGKKFSLRLVINLKYGLDSTLCWLEHTKPFPRHLLLGKTANMTLVFMVKSYPRTILWWTLKLKFLLVSLVALRNLLTPGKQSD